MATRSIDILIKARDEASAKFGKVGLSAQSLQSGLLSLGKSLMGAFGVGFGLYQVIDFARSAINAFLEYEDTVNKLRAALDLVGAGGAKAVHRMEAFADQIQSLTTYSNDAVLEIMAMGAAMGGLAGKDLEDATKAAIGLSQAYAIDLTAAMRLVARARVGDTAQLKKHGIVIEETLGPMEKFNILLEIGAEKFALAEEAARSTAGQVKQAANAWSDFKRDLGTWIVSSEATQRLVFDTMKGFSEIMARREAWSKEGQETRNEAFLEEYESEVQRYLAARGKLQAAQEALVSPKYQHKEKEILDKMAEAHREHEAVLRHFGQTADEVAWRFSDRLGEIEEHARTAAKALHDEFLDPLAFVRKLPLEELDKLGKEMAKIAKETEKLDAVQVGRFVAAMEKLFQEQADLERQAAVAAGIFSEVDAETAKYADTLGLTAEEADVLREKLQAIADLKAQLAAETSSPGGFVAAMGKLFQEQADLERQAAVAAGIFSEVDAETAKFADTLGLTAEEADVLRGKLQSIADLKAQLAAETSSPWPRWLEHPEEDGDWLKKIAEIAKEEKDIVDQGREGPVARGGEPLPAYIAQGIMRAPGQDPLVAAANRAEKQRSEQKKALDRVAAATEKMADASLPWTNAALTN